MVCVDTAAAGKGTTRQMSQVCISTGDNNNSILKGKSLQLSSQAEPSFYLSPLQPGYLPQIILEKHAHSNSGWRKKTFICTIITVTLLWMKARVKQKSLNAAQSGFCRRVTTLGQVTCNRRGFGRRY